MEEKERYELFGEHCIKDNNPDARCQLLDTYKACVILNEQDKENQQLKHQLAEKTLIIEQINKAFIENRSLWKGKYEQSNQDKISFAVEQLTQAIKNIKKCNYKDFGIIYQSDAIAVIDNQIKQLKERCKND